MKSILKYILIFISPSIFACGGYDNYGLDFYNLFKQTNISAKDFYPFLRDDNNTFYDYTENTYPQGNVILWKELLNWSPKEIENAIYKPADFNWKNKKTKLEKSAKVYIEFAQRCSEAYKHRNNRHSWDYDEIQANKSVNSEELLIVANELLQKETNQQLKTRYYYQIIRILHYSKNWKEAISFYEKNIENKVSKNEIYYYIIDQVAGCYYSTGNYDKAAYLFTKVLNKSADRKKSAFLSFNFCANKNAEGKSYFTNLEDKKDLLLITSLRNFTDEISNINKFIKLDADDHRVELLFMRALSNVEREIWPKGIGVNNQTLPFLNNNENYKKLLLIAEQQASNSKVNNKDFWKITSSYLSFIKQDLKTAKNKLNKVKSFPNQKKVLSIAYEVFSWNNISPKNEKFISKVLKKYPVQTDWRLESENNFRNYILDKIANTYYKNNQIAKSFLVHNTLETVNNISSLELLEALEEFYHKPNKTDFEKWLMTKKVDKINFLDYVNHQKGVYYLYQRKPELALLYFEKTKTKADETIPNSIFSNNITECFRCDVEKVMDDEVYKANVFSFLKTNFSLKDLANNLIELEKLRHNTKQWKVKLANYLLANYYFNISNTGYYRGLLTGDDSCCDYNYISYANDNYSTNKAAEDIISKKEGYNLYNIGYYKKNYFGLSSTAMKYYQKVIELSTDKELNARCLYLMAKCELNDYYNNGGKSFEIPSNRYYKLKLPLYKSFKTLKEDYSDTKFHKMIIKECSYYRYYSSRY